MNENTNNPLINDDNFYVDNSFYLDDNLPSKPKDVVLRDTVIVSVRVIGDAKYGELIQDRFNTFANETVTFGVRGCYNMLVDTDMPLTEIERRVLRGIPESEVDMFMVRCKPTNVTACMRDTNIAHIKKFYNI